MARGAVRHTVLAPRGPVCPSPMAVQRLLHTVDRFSEVSGKVFAWLVLVLALVVCVEVFKRYILNAPTAWIFDARKHAVRHAVHAVRGLHPVAERPRARRLPLFVDAAAHSGGARSRLVHPVLHSRHYRADLRRHRLRALSWRINEHSSITAEGPVVYPFKTIIPIAGVLVAIQGIAEIVRCVVCLRTGAWPERLATSRKSTWSASSSPTANSSTKNRDARPSRRRRRFDEDVRKNAAMATAPSRRRPRTRANGE